MKNGLNSDQMNCTYTPMTMATTTCEAIDRDDTCEMSPCTMITSASTQLVGDKDYKGMYVCSYAWMCTHPSLSLYIYIFICFSIGSNKSSPENAAQSLFLSLYIYIYINVPASPVWATKPRGIFSAKKIFSKHARI